MPSPICCYTFLTICTKQLIYFIILCESFALSLCLPRYLLAIFYRIVTRRKRIWSQIDFFLLGKFKFKVKFYPKVITFGKSIRSSVLMNSKRKMRFWWWKTIFVNCHDGEDQEYRISQSRKKNKKKFKHSKIIWNRSRSKLNNS